jgi:hypothetical protein
MIGFVYIVELFYEYMDFNRIMFKFFGILTTTIPPSLPSALSIALLIS